MQYNKDRSYSNKYGNTTHLKIVINYQDAIFRVLGGMVCIFVVFRRTLSKTYIYDIISKQAYFIVLVLWKICIAHITLYWWLLHQNYMLKMGAVSNNRGKIVYVWVIWLTVEI